MDDISIKTYDSVRGSVLIEVRKEEFLSLTERQAKIYFQELISKAIKTIVMEKYSELQRIVDEAIHQIVTQEFVEKEIKKVIDNELKEHVKDIFGK